MDDGTRVAVTLRRDLVENAEQAGVDVALTAERAIRDALLRAVDAMSPEERAARQERIRAELREEIEWYNKHVEQHGLFADEWRTF